MDNTLLENILLVDKPTGITSFDVIRLLRKKMGIWKMGHAGTLDPLASGLMIIGVNEGTKKMSEFLKLPKIYVADILLGNKSETGDREGKILEEKDTEHITDEMIRSVVVGFTGKHLLAVPMYSAIKVGGKTLYSIARKKEAGKELTEKEMNTAPPIKEMEVVSAELLEIERNGENLTIKVKMEVTSGSYIRTLAEELGSRLGVPAMLFGLRRIQIGKYSAEDPSVILP
ncbi:MAG: tRNA pseudouridine(55) synthase TruB [Candidatus Parcubacteria bacterium]|nr:tRNA pseudouridine(55) synthase TruB [Candidatus Parcubacteria bacterium]